jgi:hypothetical protein
MIGILLANREQRCAERFLTCLQTGYGGLSLAIRVPGAIQGGLTPVSALSAKARTANSY